MNRFSFRVSIKTERYLKFGHCDNLVLHHSLKLGEGLNEKSFQISFLLLSPFKNETKVELFLEITTY